MCPLLPLECFVTSYQRVGFNTVPTPPVTGVAITALITHTRKCVKGLNDSSWEFAPLTMERCFYGPSWYYGIQHRLARHCDLITRDTGILYALLESARLPCVFSLPSAFPRGGRQRGSLPSGADRLFLFSRMAKSALPSIFFFTHGKDFFTVYFFVTYGKVEL